MNKRTITLHGEPFNAVGQKLKIGQKAPDFQLVDNFLELKTLQDYDGKIKLISVVPSLDTSVCDQQTRRFNEEIDKIKNATVITVSVDLPFAQERWCGSAGLESAITLSDHREVSFGKAYGALIEELRLLARAVFVVDETNKITYVEYLEEMSKHPNYDQALAALKKLT